MYVLKKLCSIGLPYKHLVITDIPRMVFTPSCYQPILNALGGLSNMNSSIRFISSKNEKNETTKLVKLASQTYLEPVVSDDTVPIIIMHGLLGSKNNWNSLAKALLKSTNNRMIIAVDARNHGDSPHTKEFSYELMVSDLLKFMHDREITKASFIGHSLGGRVCMLLAMMYPKMVQSLVVVDISPIGHSPSMMSLPKLFKIIKSLEIDEYYTITEARKRAATQLKEKQLDDKLISFLMTNLVEKKTHTNWRWKFNLDSIINNFEKEICRFPVVRSSFAGRTLFIGGGDSDYLRREDEPHIKNLFPAAEFRYIHDAGHWVHAERPIEFLSVVSDFFSKDPK